MYGLTMAVLLSIFLMAFGIIIVSKVIGGINKDEEIKKDPTNKDKIPLE